MPDERDRPGRPPHRNYARPGTPAPVAPHSLDDSGEINPPPVPNVSSLGGDTPLVDVMRAAEERLGRLTERDRELLAVWYEHDDRGRKRSANHLLEVEHAARTGGIDVDAVRERLAVDVVNWQPFKGDREKLAKLEEAEAGRARLTSGLKKWLAGSWVVAVLALGGGLIDYGTRRGKSQAEADRIERDRAALVEATARNHAQDIEIGVLRALVRTLERNNRRDGDD